MSRYTAIECLELAMDRFDPDAMTEGEQDEFLDAAVETANMVLETLGYEPVEIVEEAEDEDDEEGAVGRLLNAGARLFR